MVVISLFAFTLLFGSAMRWLLSIIFELRKLYSQTRKKTEKQCFYGDF